MLRWFPSPAVSPAVRVATMFADDLNHSSIKACLPAVRPLNVDRGLPDHLVNGLLLQRFLWGIKRVEVQCVLDISQSRLNA